MGRRDSALADSVFSTVGVLAQGLSRFAYTAIVGRLLGASDLAAVNTAFSVAILLSLTWPTAAGNAAGAFARSDDGAGSRLLLRSFSFSLVPIVIVAASVAVALGAGWPAVVQAVLLTATWSIYIFGRGIFIGGGRVRAAAVWDVATGLLAILLLLVVIGCGWHSWLLAPAIVGYAVFGIAALTSREWAGRPAEGVSRRFTTFIFWNSLSLIATNGLMQISMIVAAGFSSSQEAGQFAAALSLATPVSMVAQAVTQALLPRFSQWSELDAASRLSNVRRATVALAVVMAAGCLLVVVVLPWALPLVYGAAFAPAVALAQGLMAAVFGFSLSVFLAAYLATIGRARTATVCTAIGSSAGLITMLFAANGLGGSVGAVVGTVVGMTLSVILLAAASLRAPAPSATPGAKSSRARR